MAVSLQRQTPPREDQSLSGDDQWYVSRNEEEYGPLRFADLAQFAKQGRLLKYDWVWKPGLQAWILASEVSGLFAEPFQFNNAPAQIDLKASTTGEKTKSDRNFKARAEHQIKDFALMFVYLWLVFGMLALHESIVLAQHQINYVAHGLAVLNALVFAKVMLVAEDLHLGHRLHDKPLIYAVVFKSVLFAIALICFHIAEHVIIGIWHGEPVSESIAEIDANRLAKIASLGIIGTIALAPFFLLSEIARVIGRDNFWALFFQRRNL